MFKLIKTQNLADGTSTESMATYSSEQRAKIEMMREIVYGYDAGFRSISIQILGDRGKYISNENIDFETYVAPEPVEEEGEANEQSE